MTIKDCIDIVDNIKPNQYTIKDKVMWLSFIDEIIINEVLKTHEGYDGRYDDFEGYSEDKLSVTLIVPSPYDRLYTAYLKMKIDGENGETARYNNSMVLYNAYMLEYRKYYNKTHMPLTNIDDRKVKPIPKTNVGLSDAEFENLKRDLTYILTEYFSNSVSGDKLYAIVNAYVQNNIAMLKGKPGYTPKYGVDYCTPEDEAKIKAYIDEQTEGLKKTDSHLQGQLDAIFNELPRIDALETTFEETTDATYNFNFSDMQNTQLDMLEDATSISFIFGNDAYSKGYMSGISFATGNTPTQISYTESGILNWDGTDCTIVDGLSIFQPSANTYYEIIFSYSSKLKQFIGRVSGFAPAIGNVVSE